MELKKTELRKTWLHSKSVKKLLLYIYELLQNCSIGYCINQEEDEEEEVCSNSRIEHTRQNIGKLKRLVMEDAIATLWQKLTKH